MVDEVRREIERIRGYISTGRLALCDETNTKATAIEPVLRELGWNVADLDVVKREYPVRARPNVRPVDYLLFCDGTPKVIVEAKRGNQSLERHQEQLQDYVGFALAKRVEIAILTNGAAWWFYLPFREVSWERRKVATVELDRQDSTETAQKLVGVLSKENVCSRRAIRNAEKHQVLEALPDVWNRLVSEPDSSIVNLLAEQTHKLCVREPDRDEVTQFLSTHFQQIRITPHPAIPEPSVPSEPEVTPEPAPSDSTREIIIAFTFNGSRYEVTSWKGMLIRLCEIVYSAHMNRFEDVLNLRGKSRPPFSRDDNDLVYPAQINGTNIFVETHGTANMVVTRAKMLIVKFGYIESDLSFETRTL